MVFILLRLQGKFEDKTNPSNLCDSLGPILFRDKFSIRRQDCRKAPPHGAARRLKKIRIPGEAAYRAAVHGEGPVNIASPGPSGK
ncbi:hypothetical protein [Burkholderia contaminans]|uniref:hypothetical protein n=1 Tax=Burkholderia contaminans TaxID=488447 RepID=UPI000F5818B7|nr:hypothetical protein [Burkholderia contaminans]MCA8155266.1 hypothetical protein [Burkholderia contaminans]